MSNPVGFAIGNATISLNVSYVDFNADQIVGSAISYRMKRSVLHDSWHVEPCTSPSNELSLMFSSSMHSLHILKNNRNEFKHSCKQYSYWLASFLTVSFFLSIASHRCKTQKKLFY